MTTYFDVTLTWSWSRPPIGLVRTEIEIAKALLKAPNTKFVRIDAGSLEPVVVSKKTLAKQILQIEAGGERRSKKSQERGKKASFSRASVLSRIRNFSPLWRLIVLLVLFPVNSLVMIAKDLFWHSRDRLGELGNLIRFELQQFDHRLTFKSIFKADKTDLEAKIGLAHTCNKPTCGWSLMGIGDVFFSVGNVWDYLPIRRVNSEKINHGFKFVGFCYDLVPIKHPEVALDGYKQKFEEYFSDLLWTADHIISISDNSQRDLQAFMRESLIDSQVRFSVSTLGCDLPKKPQDFQLPDTLKDRDFILYVSTIEKRKNHETLFNAYGELCLELGAATPSLVFVGMPGWHVEDFLRFASLDLRVKDGTGASRVHFLKDVNEAGLSWLYKTALFTVYPSIYEGWGLPISESLAHGTPVITSKEGSFREASAGFGLEVDAYDTFGWKRQMKELILNRKKLSRLRSEAERFVPKTWSEFGDEVLLVIKQISKGSPN